MRLPGGLSRRPAAACCGWCAAGPRCQAPSADPVPGDLVPAEAGDEVPADVRLVRADDPRVDEWALTGESARPPLQPPLPDPLGMAPRPVHRPVDHGGVLTRAAGRLALIHLPATNHLLVAADKRPRRRPTPAGVRLRRSASIL
ncbi:hypothetical protein ABT298_23505 [Streptomyces sp. NPDC001034]|uniref:P-type ATPase n=1 Tax=Streptomyces sp. NPDC001034 TaxID=3154375 RepID=UPI00331B26E0